MLWITRAGVFVDLNLQVFRHACIRLFKQAVIVAGSRLANSLPIPLDAF
jgi:hypothetical protein